MYIKENGLQFNGVLHFGPNLIASSPILKRSQLKYIVSKELWPSFNKYGKWQGPSTDFLPYTSVSAEVEKINSCSQTEVNVCRRSYSADAE